MSNFSDHTHTSSLKRLRQISRLLDHLITIPGTKIGIGLDPIMGLIPIGGDILGMILSGYIILEAARLGVSKTTLGKMILNIIIDALVGAIPVLGDFFDVAWTANSYNLNLLEASLRDPNRKNKADKWFILAIIAGLLLITIVLVALPVIIISMISKALIGN
ncbi:DUF4112 domain-containing protein [Cronbergia sp. UHCC 0137]|uniref:DUF4112 domain-containing protein n=1 Tax=Cronbergia sp. UHCC 0137 TaxID=3110239 RepID=UPI002B2118FA|nr:DUF4112 domain-containing protein [Cronbergia sp. UHCC 0137]MEA5620069.1 DUF4112 domain-containing protein [Cronbergia sp. UHCC 0137]